MERLKVMRFFLDCEFNDLSVRFGLEPISIALAPENEKHKSFYAVSDEFDMSKLSQWLIENVVDKLPQKDQWKSLDQIRDDILGYIKAIHTAENKPERIEFWATNGASDHVMLSGFFGGLNPMREAFNHAGLPAPRFRDLNELKKATDDKIELPKPENAHDCLVDAEHDRVLFKAMSQLLKAERRFLLD